MKKVHQLLNQKTPRLITVTPNHTVFDALNVMMTYNVSAVLIVDNNELKGIFTERDYARKIILHGKSSKESQIVDIMTPDPITVTPDDPIDDCMQLMTERHIRHLPVKDKGKLIGMISIGDLVKFVIEDQKQTIKNLEGYING